MPENQPIGTTVGAFSSTDPDAGETFTYSLVTGTGSADNASFTIVGNALQTAASFNYATKNSYQIRVRTTDAGGLTFENQFTIAVTSAPVPLVILPSDWAATGSTGMTLKLETDGKLHFYRTGTTINILTPQSYAGVTNLSITGRDDVSDLLTIDFSGGNPIPSGGLSFNGGVGAGNSLIIRGTSANDSVTMSAVQIVVNGSAPIACSQVVIRVPQWRHSRRRTSFPGRERV